jgi:hypothetical protein
MVALTNDQLMSLRRYGFSCLPHLISREEARRMRVSIERLVSRKAGLAEGAYGDLTPSGDDADLPNSPQIRNPVNYAPELHRSECFDVALKLAKQILGPSAGFFADVAILKRPRSGAATPWHQDEAFRDPRFSYREVTIWVALQDVDERSGCLMFVPGTHNGVIERHKVAGDDPEALALECVGSFDKTKAIVCSLGAGGCTIHFPRTLHCSTPNLSDIPRIAYAMTFGLPPTPTRQSVEVPWLNNRIPRLHAQRRRWMHRGGWAITIWRRLRRGDVRGWQTFRYWASRAFYTMRRGR